MTVPLHEPEFQHTAALFHEQIELEAHMQIYLTQSVVMQDSDCLNHHNNTLICRHL
ncbi:hypothetical protein D3C71_659110 [compost metagenome]